MRVFFPGSLAPASCGVEVYTYVYVYVQMGAAAVDVTRVVVHAHAVADIVVVVGPFPLKLCTYQCTHHTHTQYKLCFVRCVCAAARFFQFSPPNTPGPRRRRRGLGWLKKWRRETKEEEEQLKAAEDVRMA